MTDLSNGHATAYRRGSQIYREEAQEPRQGFQMPGAPVAPPLPGSAPVVEAEVATAIARQVALRVAKRTGLRLTPVLGQVMTLIDTIDMLPNVPEEVPYLDPEDEYAFEDGYAFEFEDNPEEFIPANLVEEVPLYEEPSESSAPPWDIDGWEYDGKWTTVPSTWVPAGGYTWVNEPPLGWEVGGNVVDHGLFAFPWEFTAPGSSLVRLRFGNYPSPTPGQDDAQIYERWYRTSGDTIPAWVGPTEEIVTPSYMPAPGQDGLRFRRSDRTHEKRDRPQPLRETKPGDRPVQERNFVIPLPLPAPTTGPGTLPQPKPSPAPAPVTGPPVMAPPQAPTSPKEKERKVQGSSKMVRLVWWAANQITESIDVLEVLYEALPEHLRSAYRENRQGEWVKVYQPSVAEMAQDVYENFDRIDLNRALMNAVVNQLEDKIIGGTAGSANKNLQDWYQQTGRPVGLTAGPAL